MVHAGQGDVPRWARPYTAPRERYPRRVPNRTSHLRRQVLEQLRTGSATGPELAAGALERRGGRARKLILVWLEAGFITREREPWVGPGAAPYRYTITELGIAVLEADEL